MKLHTYGLLSDSFRLEEKMEGVRTIWRLRDRQVKDGSRAVQLMQKALTKINIELANVISDITGASGQAIITKMKGERDPWKQADLKHDLVRASRDEVARSPEGNWRAVYGLKPSQWRYAFPSLKLRAGHQRSCFAVRRSRRIVSREALKMMLIAVENGKDDF